MSSSKPVCSSSEADTIIPFHFSDDFPHLRAICLSLTLRFDDQLDPVRLQNSLSRLLEIDNWRKIGSRLRLTKSNRLTYHLPQTFTKARPGFIFTTETHDSNISSHPLASKMPTCTEYASNASIHILDSMSQFSSLSGHESGPTKLTDWLEADIPQLHIHTVLFNNATLLTITLPHTLTDAMGISGFLNAWSNVLSEREENIPPFLGFDQDVVEDAFEQVPASQHVLAAVMLGYFSILVMLLFRWWENFWYPTVMDRVVVVPGAFVEKLRETVMQGLEDEMQSDGSGDTQDKPFVSESDVLLALISNLLVSAHDLGPRTAVHVGNVFDIRPVLGITGGVYIGNATLAAYTLFQANEFGIRGGVAQSTGLGSVARKIRHALEAQRTKEQVSACASLWKKALRETGKLPILGDPRQVDVLCTNWQRAKFFDIDFEGARVGRYGDGSTCKPSYINVAAAGPMDLNAMRNLVTVVGKDERGNWWVQAVAREEVWEKIEKWVRVD